MDNQKKQIFLHIGPPKTGTTTIEMNLHVNEETLFESGYLYAKTGRSARVNFAGNHNLAWQLICDPLFLESEGVWADFVKEVEQTSCEKIIISSDVFASLELEKVRLIRQLLQNCQVMIVLYLRRQDSLLQSVWTQVMKMWGQSVTSTFTQWMDSTQNYYWFGDYAGLIERWAQVFGKKQMIVRVLEKQQLEGALFHDFLYSCGVDNFNQYPLSSDVNISPGPKTLEIIRQTKIRIHSKFNMGLMNMFLNPILEFGKKNFVSDSKPNYIDPTLYKKIMHMYSQGNKKIAQEYFGRDDLFLEPFIEKPITHFSIEEFSSAEIFDLFAFIVERILLKMNDLETRLFELEQRFQLQKKSLNQMESSVSSLLRQNQHLQKKIAEMESTRGWQLLEKYRHLRTRIRKFFGRKQ